MPLPSPRTRTPLALLVLVLSSGWIVAQAPQVPPPAQERPPQSAGATQVGEGQNAGRGQGRGGRGPRLRKVVIAWADTRNGVAQHESTSHALSVIERLGYETGMYDTFIRTDSNIISNTPAMTTGGRASGGPSLAIADAIFFLGHRDVPLDDAQKAELAAFVRGGKGFVAAHVGLTAFESWPEFGELIGARYGGHPWGTTAGTIINEDPSFPATKHFGSAPFAFSDEFYQPKDFSRENARVLLRLDVSKLPASDQLLRKDGDFPLVWAKTFGKGRVFYSSLGHAASTWDNRDVQQMYLEALRWALGMTEGDATPRPFGAPK